jgi:ubiquitin carboxyl-terminal hydrolase 25/28
VLQYDQYKLDVSQNGGKGKDGRVGQRMISMVEIEGGQAFAADLKHLFERMIKSRDSAVKPETNLVCRAFLEPKEYKLLGRIIDTDKSDKPGDATVNGAIEAIDEKLTDGETLTSPTTIEPQERKASDASSTTLQASVNGEGKDVAMKDAEMPPTPPGTPGLEGKEQAPPLPPRRFSTTKEEALAKAEANAKQQQDVTEVHDKISFLLRCGIKPRGWDQNGEQEDAFRDLFAVRLTQTAVNKGVEQKPLLLPDSAIQLNVPMEPTDIYSALDAVFDLQPYADNPAIETYKSIEALPPLLQINIPRIGYDVTRAAGASFKSTECVSLKDVLYLDRYCDVSHENTLPKRRQCWGWRRQLEALKREQKLLSKTSTDLDGPTAVAQTAEYLTSIDAINRDLEEVGVEAIEADGEITAALIADAEQQAKRLSALESEIDGLQKQLDAQFEDMKNIKYQLAAVFFHRGSYGHGHYWIYIHDFVNNVWRIYNDERVEEFTKLESIFEAKTWDQGTPTYAVYVAEDKIDYVQAVFRDLEPAPDPPATGEWKEVGSTNTESQQDSVTTVDPKVLTRPMVTESTNASWDEERQVTDFGGSMGW